MFLMLITLGQLASGTVFETDLPEQVVIEKVETWAALSFVSAQDAVQKTGSTFIAKGNINWPCKGMGCMVKKTWRLHFTLRVDVKPGRFRVKITDPELSWPPDANSPAYHGVIRNKRDQKAAATALEGLLNELAGSVQSTVDDDW